MTRLFAGAALFIFCTNIGAQPPAFALADVHASPPRSSPGMTANFLPNGRYEVRGATMLGLITMAWGVESEKVYGGPGWLDSDRFDIIAKAPPESTEADRALMLRALLAERFGLVTHEDQKPLPVFALIQGKRNSQLKASEASTATECNSNTDQGPPLQVSYVCRSMTMASLAAGLRARERSAIDRPVIDMTDLKGAWDFTIKYTPTQIRQRAIAAGQPAGVSILDAMETIGLKLDPRKQAVAVIAIDHVNRTPTENAPGISKNIPAAPSEFEVADIKPSKPGTTLDGGFRPGGRLDIQGATVKELIGAAWEFDDNRVAGGPKWIETDRFDIVAKAPEHSPDDTLRLMLRSLLIEHFKLATHTEDRPVAVFALTAGKSPKLKVADPQSRSGCKMSLGQLGSGTATIPLRICTCQNTTMAQFAEFLRPNAAAYIDHPVVDLTGLKGAYDFTVSWTGKGMINLGQNRKSEDGLSDPMGGRTVFEGIDKDLGLKLEGGKKHPLPVLVVDRVEPLAGGN